MSCAQQQQQQQQDNLDPFNHYNTEFIKLDANNWQEESGKCEPPALNQFVCLKTSLDSFDESWSPPMASNINNQQQLHHYADTINVMIYFYQTYLLL